jgi:hypothetical protein
MLTTTIVIGSILIALAFVWWTAVRLGEKPACQFCVCEDEMFDRIVNRMRRGMTLDQLKNSAFMSRPAMYCQNCGRGPIDASAQAARFLGIQAAPDSKATKQT